MRVKIVFNVASLCFKADVKRTMVSYLKNALQSYDESLFQEVYGGNKIKKFTFSLYLPGIHRDCENLSLKQNFIIWEIGTNDPALGINIYNALLKVKNLSYPMGTTTIKCEKISISTIKTYTAKNIIIRFKSPLVIRERVEKRDSYYTMKDEEFRTKFKDIVNYQLEALGYEKDDSIDIKMIDGSFVMDQAFGLMIPSSIGTYMLSGKKETMDLLSKIGAGSRRGEGFGMFDVLVEVNDE